MRRLLNNPGFAWVPGLTSRAAARQIDDVRFTDEEILTVVRAGESGMKLADLCEATGIPVETYYDWKARYGGLSPQQVHRQRLRMRSRKRRLVMLACLAAVAAMGVGGLLSTRRSDAAPFVPPVMPNRPTPAVATVVAPPKAASTAPPDAAAASATGTITPPAAAATAGPADSTASAAAAGMAAAAGRQADGVSDPQGYSVQVAALPDLQQARIALERLAAAGYPAHITTKNVNRVEMFRVRVGPVDSRDAAEQVAARLRRDGYASPWVTQ
jgi:cell division septation protein DedD